MKMTLVVALTLAVVIVGWGAYFPVFVEKEGADFWGDRGRMCHLLY